MPTFPVVGAMGSVLYTAVACIGPVIALCRCGGDEFGLSDPSPFGEPGSSDGDIPSRVDAHDSGSAGSGGSSADSASLAWCATLRTGDAPRFDREACIPAGKFMMGSSDPNLGNAFADHTPIHSVSLSAFVVDVYEVTVSRYRACVQSAGCSAPPDKPGGTWTATPGAGDSLPMTFVIWSEADAYCKWDGGRRLPTEARWEYLARGEQSHLFPWGDSFDCTRAVLGGYTGGPCTAYAGPLPHVVGSLPQGRTASGVFDIVGNVSEWVADHMSAYPAGPVTDPAGPTSGPLAIVRGGSWANSVNYGKGFARAAAPPDSRGPWGFRCTRDK